MKNRKLAQKIIRLAALDQKTRRAYKRDSSLVKELKKIDRTNLVKMKKIVKKFGWPTISLVGKKASHFAWLLVQHADSDIKFQEKCLRLMKKLVEKNEVLKSDIAFLVDKVLVNRGKPQIYGTQFYKDKNDKLIPRPIRNPRVLDERRKAMGLESFEGYKKRIRIAKI